MHASTKQLLSLRDSELVAADVRQHVAECEQCQNQLQQLRAIRHLLQDVQAINRYDQILAMGGNKLDCQWQIVKEGVQSRKQQRRSRLKRWSIAVSVVTCMTILPFVGSQQSEQPEETQANIDREEPSALQLQAQLIERNKQLEDALRELPDEPKVVRGGTAYAIVSFEDQIALVDYELSYGQAVGIDDTQSLNLLRNRAELLDSLYKVRYTQAMAGLAHY